MAKSDDAAEAFLEALRPPGGAQHDPGATVATADNPRLSAKRPRETADLAAGAARMIRALGVRVASEDAELSQFRALAGELERALAHAIAGLRGHGMSDGQIGRELGVTKQAVAKRFPRR